jgi:hypothetical protein
MAAVILVVSCSGMFNKGTIRISDYKAPDDELEGIRKEVAMS